MYICFIYQVHCDTVWGVKDVRTLDISYQKLCNSCATRIQLYENKDFLIFIEPSTPTENLISSPRSEEEKNKTYVTLTKLYLYTKKKF